MPLPLLPIILGLTAAKTAVDAYSTTRTDRYGRRLRDRQEEDAEVRKKEAKRAAIMRALKVNAPTLERDLKPLPEPPDLTGPNTLSGLLGFAGNAAALYGASTPQAMGPGVPKPMPYDNYKPINRFGNVG